MSKRGNPASEPDRETLALWCPREREALAREGYEYYADEAREFAEATSKAIAEALGDDDGPVW